MDRLLLDYIPNFLREIKEYGVICETEQTEIEELWKATDQVLNDNFILYAGQTAVEHYEKMLGIAAKATTPLQDRKFRVLARLNEQLPYTELMLRYQLETLCGKDGYTFILKHELYTLIVKVALTSKNNLEDVQTLLDRVMPANMVIDLDLLYNQHQTLAGFTHAQLAKWTHQGLREEVLHV